MNYHNFPKNNKAVLVLLVFSIALVGTPIVVNAVHPPGSESVTKSIFEGSNIVSFRDTTNLLLESSTITADTSSIKAGLLKITVEDRDANLDKDGIDLVLSSATSTTSGSEMATTILEETGPNSGVFMGEIKVNIVQTSGDSLQVNRGDEISVFYEEEPDAVGRILASVDIPIAAGGVSASEEGTITITDGNIGSSSEEFGSTCPFDLYTHPVNVEFTGVIPDPDNIAITISYANTIFGGNTPFGGHTYKDLEVVYRATEFSSFRSLTTNLDRHNEAEQTITSQLPPQEFTIDFPTGTNGNGQYALAIDLGGCTGGGGGGLVRPGLVVNALAGSGAISALFAGGSGDGPTEPTFGDATFTLMGNSSGEEGFGGIIAEPATLDSTQTVEVGEEVVLRFDLYENQGINNIETINLYFNFAGENYDKSFIDTYITYNRGEITLVDPNDKFEYADIEILQKDGWNLVVKATLNFANTMDTSNILIESIDLDRNYGKQFFPDAIQVVQPSITLADSKNEFAILKQDNSNVEIQDQQLNHIPIWVKSNALWWKQQQIDDSDFVAGIKYLINQAIIDIPQKDSSSVSIHEVPQWLRDVAGFWADDSISDDEFVQAMQWLIENQVINIQQ